MIGKDFFTLMNKKALFIKYEIYKKSFKSPIHKTRTSTSLC